MGWELNGGVGLYMKEHAWLKTKYRLVQPLWESKLGRGSDMQKKK